MGSSGKLINLSWYVEIEVDPMNCDLIKCHDISRILNIFQFCFPILSKLSVNIRWTVLSWKLWWPGSTQYKGLIVWWINKWKYQLKSCSESSRRKYEQLDCIQSNSSIILLCVEPILCYRNPRRPSSISRRICLRSTVSTGRPTVRQMTQALNCPHLVRTVQSRWNQCQKVEVMLFQKDNNINVPT